MLHNGQPDVEVLAGLHKEIIISFLAVEHIKFLPDWCLGFSRGFSSRQNDSSAVCNTPQLNSKSDGTIIVPTFMTGHHFALTNDPDFTAGHHQNAPVLFYLRARVCL